jgi:C1A family cysteine protease
MTKRKYGWNPSRPDHRDLKFALGRELKPESELPQEVDQESEFPPCYDQGSIGSCTGNGLSAGCFREMYLQHTTPTDAGVTQDPSGQSSIFIPSRLFIYYNERDMEGTVGDDAGANIRDGIKAINRLGVCPEAQADGKVLPDFWTYDDGPVKIRQKPPQECYDNALLHRAIKYESVNLDRLTVLNAIAEGKSIVFGFSVPTSFESDEMAHTGIMKVPSMWEGYVGGHCVITAGYKLGVEMGLQGVKDWIKVRNSWGPHWGQNGYFWMPLDQVFCHPGMCSDGWAITLMSNLKQVA